jgi:hypothetical protein
MVRYVIDAPLRTVSQIETSEGAYTSEMLLQEYRIGGVRTEEGLRAFFSSSVLLLDFPAPVLTAIRQRFYLLPRYGFTRD